MNILVSAFACEPNQGSEPGIGWQTVRALAESHQVWVVTYTHHRAAIERELAERPVPSLHVRYHKLPRVLEWLNRDFQGIGINFHYYLWQAGAALIGRRLAEEIEFDFALHSTYVRYWQPSFFALLPIPFVWGPIGGGESAPLSLWRGLGIRGQCFEAARVIARWCGEHDPFVRLTARRSTLCFAATEATLLRGSECSAPG